MSPEQRNSTLYIGAACGVAALILVLLIITNVIQPWMP